MALQLPANYKPQVLVLYIRNLSST